MWPGYGPRLAASPAYGGIALGHQSTILFHVLTKCAKVVYSTSSNALEIHDLLQRRRGMIWLGWGMLLRLLAMLGVMAALLTMFGCIDQASAQTDGVRCEVRGVLLERASYSPMTGKAEVIYTYAGGHAIGTAYVMASISVTENQARLEAYKQAKSDAFRQISQEVCKPRSEPATTHK